MKASRDRIGFRVTFLPFPLARCLAATLATLAADGAYAACAPTATPGSNTSVVCDGATTGSASVIATPGSTGVGITVNNGATLSTNATQVLLVRDASTITNNGTITVSGGSGPARAAMVATGNDNTLTNNGAIRTTSSSTSGILVTSNSSTRTVITNNGSISTTGGSSHGVSMLGPGNTVINNGTINTSGTSAKGVYLQGGNLVANLLVNTGTITTTGANSPAGGADAVHANTLGSSFFSRVENRAGGTLSSANGYGYRGQNGNDVLVNAGTIEGHGGAANTDAIYMGALGNGTLILQTGSVIRGGADGGVGKTASTFLEGTGTVDNAFRNFQNLTMRGTEWSWLTDANFSDSIRVESGRFTLPATLTSPVITVLPGTTVAGTGTFAGNVTNQGTLLPGPNDGVNFGAFTVRGNYFGGSGALMQVNTVLAGDNSPSDKLVIDGGAASGSTGIRVVNRGGLGAPTLADGILVVQALNGATTAPTAFSLTQAVEAGAYNYRLFRGGAAGNNPDNWYLRNNGYLVGGTVVGSLTEALAVLNETPPVPGAPPAAMSVEPVKLYRPEVRSTAPCRSRCAASGSRSWAASTTGRATSNCWPATGTAKAGRPRGAACSAKHAAAPARRCESAVRRQRPRPAARPRLPGGHRRRRRTQPRRRAGWLHARQRQRERRRRRRHQRGGRPAERGGLQPRRVLDPHREQRLVQRRRAHGHPLQDRRDFHARPRRQAARQDDHRIAGSGLSVALSDTVTLQPQAQLIWQRSSIDDFDDGLSTVRFQRDNAVTGRLGARLEAASTRAAASGSPT